MATTPIPLVVASHNLMHGRRLEALLPHYLALRDRERLDLLCLQEDRFPERVEDGSPPSARIAAALGPSYRAVRHPESAALAIVYDGRVIACGDRTVIPLPRLSGLSWFERLYVAEGRTKQKQALVAELRLAGGGRRFAAVSFHLDTAGGNRHRAAQVRAIADGLRDSGRHDFVGGGDTNAFAWRGQPEVLRALLAPLVALGAADPGDGAGPTHYFARQDEPKLTHRLGVALGKLGLDVPRRYDVVCSTFETLAHGQVVTPGSDHDLVWARVGVPTTGSH